MQVLTTGETYEDVEKIQLAEGVERQIDVIKSPVRDANGNIVGVQVMFRDVTEELEMEAALKNSEQRLQAILDNTSAIIYIKDTTGNYLLINREFETLFGVTLMDVIGKSDYDLFPRDFADAFRSVDRKVVERRAKPLKQKRLPRSPMDHIRT